MNEQAFDAPVKEAERRLVTVLFGDLVGYTTFSEGRDPELVRESLNLTFERLAVEATRLGGYVDKIVGDEIMVLFGAPVSHEDDAGRAIEAGLAMQRVLADLGPRLEREVGSRLRIRIGINTGLVVTGAVGPGAYTVTGDAVNVAARLEKAAEPDQVLVGEATRRLARRQFQWNERLELTVKGRTEPVACFVVERLEAGSRLLVPSPSSTPFVGRNEKLVQLNDAWQRSKAGESAVVELIGEAGIGKTRLLAHFFSATDISPDHMLYARADTPPRTFGPLLELLPSLQGGTRREFQERLQALLDAREADTPPRLKADWLVASLAELIGVLAASGPVALVLDDMHRADRATVDVVERLLPRLGQARVFVALLRQPVGRRQRHMSPSSTFTLDPLAPLQAADLVSTVAPTLSEARQRDIVSSAGGNALYLEMLAQSATAGGATDAIPASLQAAVVARLDELSHVSRQLLREASVLGQSFYEEPLKLMSSVRDSFFEMLEQLCDIGLLDAVPGQARSYQFRHSLVQQVLYDGLVRRARIELHNRAVEALQVCQNEGFEIDPSVIAYHLEQAGDPQRAAMFHLAAAEQAEVLRAPSESRAHRRAANRLLTIASLTEMYSGTRRPGGWMRATGASIHLMLALALVLPLFAVLATRRPEQSALTLGLPLDIISFNVSAVVLAVAIGGAPLLIAGIIFSHLAAPALLRRHVPPWRLLLVLLGGWVLGLAAIAVAFGTLVGLLRLNAVDKLTEMYVGATTLRFLVGDYHLAIAVAIATLVVAAVWTATLRLQVRSSSRRDGSAPRPLQSATDRPWMAVRQTGVLFTGGAFVSAAVFVPYQFGFLPDGSLQTSLSIPAFAFVVSGCVLVCAVGLVAVWASGRHLRARTGLSLFGFEAPLVCALAVGILVWFGMRQAVVMAANDVDSPGHHAAYGRAARLFPNLVFAQYLLGERDLAREDFESARLHLERAIQLDPSFPASYLPHGRVLIANGDLQGAAADADRLIALKPEHPAGYALHAWVDALRHDGNALTRDLTMATRPLPANTQAWDSYFIQCLVLDAAKQSDAAQAACEHAVQLNPRHYQSLNELGFFAFNRGDYEAAVTYWTHVLGIDDSVALIWSNRGISYENLNRYSDAEPDLKHALEIAPREPVALVHLSEVEVHLGKENEARDAADRAVSIDDTYRCNRLFVDRYTDDYEHTIEDVTTLLVLEQSDRGCQPSSTAVSAYLLSSRGLAYIQTGQMESGFADLDAAIRIAPDFAPAYDRRGYAYFLQHDYARATDDFAQVLSRLSTLSDEPSAEFHYHRAQLLNALGNHDLAVAEITQARKQAAIPSVQKAIDGVAESFAVVTNR